MSTNKLSRADQIRAAREANSRDEDVAIPPGSTASSSSSSSSPSAIIPPAMTPAERRAAEHAEERRKLLKRTLKDAHETHEIAAKTSASLSKQGQQIAQISTKLDGMEADLKVADMHTSSIGSWFGMVWNMVRGAPGEAKATPNAAAAAAVDTAKNVGRNPDEKPTHHRHLNSCNSTNSSTANGTGQQQHQGNDQDDDEEHALLDQLANSVAGMKITASNQNTVIKAQNQALDATQSQMDGVYGHLRKSGRDVNKLI